MTQLRIVVLADCLEEGWPSMDLVADRLVAALRARATGIDPLLVRPAMHRRVSRLPGCGRHPRAVLLDRLATRYVDYPLWLKRRRPDAAAYHVIDHSYAHLLQRLPAARTIVTCHDLDAFAPVLGGDRVHPGLFRRLVASTLRGLQSAARVVCVSDAVRDELATRGIVPLARLRVVPNGVDAMSSREVTPAADAQAERLLGRSAAGRPTLLHVGSAIPRKRIDVLLRAFAEVVRERPSARLVRVGGLTDEQRRLATELGIRDRVEETPFVDRDVLEAIYRRADVTLLTSDGEGFGLPVLESLAAGVPVVATDLPALRQTGGDAAVYCRRGDAGAFARAALALVDERHGDRRQRGLERAARFTWAACAERMEAIYREVVGNTERPHDPLPDAGS
jgi:glycosyltransferase involved in cell wall biosynthesis